METKPFYLSKTIIFNFILAVVAGVMLIDSDILTLIGIAAEKQAGILKIVGIIAGVGNIWLRKATTTSISITKTKSEENGNGTAF